MPLRGAIVKIVTQDSSFLDNLSSSGFLLSNSAFIVPFFACGFKFYVYYNTKPKPPSGPGSAPEGGSPAGSEGVVLDSIEA